MSKEVLKKVLLFLRTILDFDPLLIRQFINAPHDGWKEGVSQKAFTRLGHGAKRCTTRLTK
jgi:hypothetical protein